MCGEVVYETGELGAHIDHCHCTFCQKFHGAAFGSYIEVLEPASLKWIKGEKFVKKYQSSSHSARLFCGECGSSLVAWINDGEIRAVTLGTLDESVKEKPFYHMFASSKASWYDIPDKDEKYDEYPPSMSQFTPTD